MGSRDEDFISYLRLSIQFNSNAPPPPESILPMSSIEKGAMCLCICVSVYGIVAFKYLDLLKLDYTRILITSLF